MHAFSTKREAKSRHPFGGVVAALAGAHSPAGERPARLLRVLARMRAATLFCFLRPGRACQQNSPARPSGKAGPPRFVAAHNASLRSFLPCSAVPRPNQGGPVSPDGRAASAVRMLRTFSPPWTGYEKADREIRVGANVPLPAAWARRASVRIAVYRISIRASAYRNAICRLRRSVEGCQHLLGVGDGLAAVKSGQRLLGVGGAMLGACSLAGAKAGLRISVAFCALARIGFALPSAGWPCSPALEAPSDCVAPGSLSARIGLAQPSAGWPRLLRSSRPTFIRARALASPSLWRAGLAHRLLISSVSFRRSLGAQP